MSSPVCGFILSNTQCLASKHKKHVHTFKFFFFLMKTLHVIYFGFFFWILLSVLPTNCNLRDQE